MVARVVRLVTHPERLLAEEGLAVRRAIQALPDDVLPGYKRVLALQSIDRATQRAPSEKEWPGGYSMISLVQIGRVWDAIRELPARDRPSDVRRAFDLVLLNLVPHEGRVDLTREQFAEKMGCAPGEASKALGVLVRLGVLFREVMRVPGVRGPGVAVFFINPNVAWNGDLSVRKSEAAKRPGPLLKLMEDGAR